MKSLRTVYGKLLQQPKGEKLSVRQQNLLDLCSFLKKYMRPRVKSSSSKQKSSSSPTSLSIPSSSRQTRSSICDNGDKSCLSSDKHDVLENNPKTSTENSQTQFVTVQMLSKALSNKILSTPVGQSSETISLDIPIPTVELNPSGNDPELDVKKSSGGSFDQVAPPSEPMKLTMIPDQENPSELAGSFHQSKMVGEGVELVKEFIISFRRKQNHVFFKL
jgi:hypothetical protein